MVCLVCIEKSTKRKQGISFLLVDPTSPGVEVCRIMTLDSDYEVNGVSAPTRVGQ
jgi:hypothetical protein